MPYAFHLDGKGFPDAEGRARCDAALAHAHQQKNYPTIFLGAGMWPAPGGKKRCSLAGAAFRYLRSHGWPSRQILSRPAGYNTATETMAFWYFLQEGRNNLTAEVATSWWHAPRVKMICRLVFGHPVKVHTCPSTHSVPRLSYDIVREIAAFPKSFLLAMKFALRQKRRN